jgi:integrase
MGDVRQARLLARRQSEIEAAARENHGERLDEWVLPWIIEKYGQAETSTAGVYKRWWRAVARFLDEEGIATAGQVRRELAGKYLAWRGKHGGGRNSAIAEMKLLGMVMDEAKARGHCQDNPLRRLGIKRDKPAEKLVWSDADITRAAAHFEREKSHWMLCAFYFGLYQAARLRQCQLPISAIRLEARVISYSGNLVKGGEGFTQPIDGRFLPILTRLVSAAKGNTLCAVPWDASIRLRRSLDRAGLPGLCQHGLRATWITRAAQAGVPESQAMAFCHHESREVHRVYKKLSSISITHVPDLVSLPSLVAGGDACAASSGNGGELNKSRIRGRSRDSDPHGQGSGSSRKTGRARSR